MGCATKIPVKSLRLKKARRTVNKRESSSSDSESPGSNIAKVVAIAKKQNRSKRGSECAMEVDAGGVVEHLLEQATSTFVEREDLQNFEPENMKSSQKAEFVVALAKVLQAVLAEQQGKSTQITRFHGVSAPSMTVDSYLKRLRKYFDCSHSCLLTSLIYIDRIVKLHPTFPICDRTIHRIIGVSMMVSAKFQDDVFYSNCYYAKVCGLTVKEMNALEGDFLKLLAWKCDVSPAEYDEYHCRVINAVQK